MLFDIVIMLNTNIKVNAKIKVYTNGFILVDAVRFVTMSLGFDKVSINT